MPGYDHSQHRNIPYSAAIALDYVRGVSSERKFGRGNVGTSFQVIAQGDLLWLPTTAVVVRVKAGGNAADTAAGTGAQEITVEGLDADGLAVSATLATAGASASSATTQTFLRVNRAYVSSAGSGEINVAAVTIEIGAGGTDVIIIAADYGQSESSHISVPSGEVLLVQDLRLYANSVQAATVRVMLRTSTGERRSQQAFVGASEPIDVGQFTHHAIFNGGIVDFWVEAAAASSTADISSSMTYHLYDTAS